MQDEAYQKEYDAARAQLEAEQSTTSRGLDEQPAVEEKPAETPKVEEIPPVEPVADVKTEEPKAEVDPLVEIRAELEKTQKALKDTQAWGTKNAQRLAEIERERERQQREANKPAILDANPELAEAIRYVAGDPAPQQKQVDQQQQWLGIVDKAHPGIFDASVDPELVNALLAKREALGDSWHDPLVAIREITAEKLAHAERQIGKRFAAESAKLSQKSAMSVPGAGASAVQKATVDPDLAEVQRIQKMSPAEFEAEVKRVKGY